MAFLGTWKGDKSFGDISNIRQPMVWLLWPKKATAHGREVFWEPMSPNLTSGKLNRTLRLGKIKDKKRGTLISKFGYFLWGNDNRGKKEIYWYFLRGIEFSRGVLGWDGTGAAPRWGANAAGGPSAGPATQPPCRRLRESQDSTRDGCEGNGTGSGWAGQPVPICGPVGEHHPQGRRRDRNLASRG